jgi:hypothetical protein
VPVTVTTYGVELGVVGPVGPVGEVGVVALTLFPPHPAANPPIATSISSPSTDFQLRRRTGTPKKSSAAIAAPASQGSIRLPGNRSAAVVPEVVDTVSVAIAAPLAVTVGEDTVQVGGLVAPVGTVVRVQVIVTGPTNPLIGVTVIIDVPLDPAAAIVIAGVTAASEKFGPSFTLTTVEEGWNVGEAPIYCTVIGFAPGVRLELFTSSVAVEVVALAGVSIASPMRLAPPSAAVVNSTTPVGAVVVELTVATTLTPAVGEVAIADAVAVVVVAVPAATPPIVIVPLAGVLR